jgi:hypothetical protein
VQDRCLALATATSERPGSVTVESGAVKGSSAAITAALIASRSGTGSSA